jgi:hypothetical protein
LFCSREEELARLSSDDAADQAPQGIGQQIAEAGVPAHDQSELKRFDQQRKSRAHPDGDEAPRSREPKADSERNEEEQVEHHIYPSVVTADETPEWGSSGCGGLLREGWEGGDADDEEPNQGKEQSRSAVPLVTCHTAVPSGRSYRVPVSSNNHR